MSDAEIATSPETMDFEGIQLKFAGPLATLIINDPQRRNALSATAAVNLVAALNECAKPRRKIRCIMITGAGESFCAGANLAADAAAIGAGKGSVRGISGIETAFHPALNHLAAVTIPLVAAVDGPCVGIGVGIALSCDYVVASERAFFLTPFVNLASATDSGLAWRLQRLIGVQRTRRMLLRAERVPATTALDWGLVTETVPVDTFQAVALGIAEGFANGPTIALSEIKKLINDDADCSLETAMEREVRAVARTSRTKDNVAAMRVFGKKEKPTFTGE